MNKANGYFNINIQNVSYINHCLDFHLYLQKSVGMQPILCFFLDFCFLSWRFLTLSFPVPKTIDLDSLRFSHHFHTFKNFVDTPNDVITRGDTYSIQMEDSSISMVLKIRSGKITLVFWESTILVFHHVIRHRDAKICGEMHVLVQRTVPRRILRTVSNKVVRVGFQVGFSFHIFDWQNTLVVVVILFFPNNGVFGCH